MEFLEPGHFVRIWDRELRRFVFYRLLEREGPLKYPYTYAVLKANTTCSEKIFEDLNPSKNHIYQCFLGIRDGLRLNVWHPYDEKMLLWDETDLDDVSSSDTANLEYEDTPYDEPTFQFWIIRDRYPGFVVKNLYGNRKVRPQIIVYGMKFDYEVVTDPALLDKLTRGLVRCTPISWRKLED